MKNNKGFTLIELLAVIVVLSVIITIAATNVLPQMNIAREGAFRAEATLFAKNSKELYANYAMGATNITNSQNACVSKTKACFTVSELIRLGLSDLNDNYTGKVILDLDNQTITGYHVSLKKADEYWFINEPYSDFKENGKLNDGSWTSEYETCSCE